MFLLLGKGVRAVSERIWNLFFDHLPNIMFPEDWLAVGLAMSRMELMALLLIWTTGEIIMTQLAESLEIPMSTATGVVDRLAKKGYVERLVDESNRRIVTVRLTARGRECSEGIKQTIMKYFNRILSGLTEQEKEVLYKLFARVIAMFTGTDAQEKESATTLKKITIE